MGNLYKQENNFGKARYYYDMCLEIKEKLKGPTSLDVAFVYNNIGVLYRKMENFIEAEKYYKMCLMIRTQVKGDQSYLAA